MLATSGRERTAAMHLRLKKRVALGATIAVALAAWIGTSAGGAAGGAGSAKGDVLPATLAKMIANPESAVAEFGLEAARARHADLHSGAGGVWFIPGRTGGACLFQSNGGGSCANADQIANGGLVLVVLPPPSAESPGSATFIGYAPAGVTAIRLVDEDGGVVSEITPQGDTGIYDFRLARRPGASAAVKLILADASGKAVSTLPMPGSAPG
jgi:hypothetical protein